MRGAQRQHLLLVDDERDVLTALRRLLRSYYEVSTFSSPLKALEHLTDGVSCDAILSDLKMPEMNGIEFARTATAIRPDLAGRIIFMTGGAPAAILANVRELGVPLLFKPFEPDALRALLAGLAGSEP